MNAPTRRRPWSRKACPWNRLPLWAAIALALGGCAAATGPPPAGIPSPLPGSRPAAPPPGSPPSPIPGTPVGTTASGGTITTASSLPVVVDSLPSADALAVLETIPEPLGSRERVPAPVRPSERDSAARGAPARGGGAVSGADATARSEAEDARAVPIPAPMPVLGDRSAPGVEPRDRPSTEAPGPGSSAPAGAGAPPAAAAKPEAARPDSCWRVQVSAPPEPERARALREAAESQLLVPMVVELEKGLHKVRSRDCLAAEAAARLRDRAQAAGFEGAFRFLEKRR